MENMMNVESGPLNFICKDETYAYTRNENEYLGAHD